MNLLALIGSLTLGKVENIDAGRDEIGYGNPLTFDAELGDANVITSLVKGDNGKSGMIRKHKVLLDLDVPAYLLPSSTEGNSHLYIDVECSQHDYFDLLDALARCGVIEDGYCRASGERGATALRLPWVKKHKVDITPLPKPADDPWMGLDS